MEQLLEIEVSQDTKNEVLPDLIVKQTRDYSIFKKLRGNRGFKETHVKRLVKSYSDGLVFRVVLVNEFMEVIDGQHGLEACKRLGLTVIYRIEPGLRLPDAQRINTASQKWNKQEFLDSFREIGNPNYIRFNEFRNTYPQFVLNIAEYIVTDSADGVNKTKQIAGVGGVMKGINKGFEKGEMVIDISTDEGIAQWQTAFLNGQRILDFMPYHKRCTSRSFVLAMLRVLRNPNYDHQRMMKSLRLQPTRMVNCTCVKDYLKLIREIYNYKLQNKVWF